MIEFLAYYAPPEVLDFMDILYFIYMYVTQQEIT